MTLDWRVFSLFFLLILIGGAGFMLYAMKRSEEGKATPEPPLKGKVYEVELLGWVVYWDAKSEKRFVENADKFTWVSPTWYDIDGNGDISERGFSEKLIQVAREHGVKVVPLIANKGFSSEVGHSILTDPEIREKVLEGIVKIVAEKNYDGINIDFEGIDPADREALSRFICDLSERLHGLGKELSIDVPAKTRATYEGWSGAFDYAELAKCVDYLVIMIYDYHWSGGEPGPVSPLGWFKQVLSYVVATVPKEKIVAGIPVYGYDWPAGGKGRGITYEECVRQAELHGVEISFDAESGEVTYKYESGGVLHEVWCNTAKSAELRFEAALEYGINRIAFWRVGAEDPRFWSIIKRPG